MIKGEPLLNWLKAIAHITRCTRAAIYFLIKVLFYLQESRTWASVLSLERGVWEGSHYKENAFGLLSLIFFLFFSSGATSQVGSLSFQLPA